MPLPHDPTYPTADAKEEAATAMTLDIKTDEVGYLIDNGLNQDTVTPVMTLIERQEIVVTNRADLIAAFKTIAEKEVIPYANAEFLTMAEKEKEDYKKKVKNLSNSLTVNPNSKIMDAILKLCKQKTDLAKSLAPDKVEYTEALDRTVHKEGVWTLKKLLKVQQSTDKENYPYVSIKTKRMYTFDPKDDGTIARPPGCDKAIKGLFNAITESSQLRIRDFWILICGDDKDKIEEVVKKSIDNPNLSFPKGFLEKWVPMFEDAFPAANGMNHALRFGKSLSGATRYDVRGNPISDGQWVRSKPGSEEVEMGGKYASNKLSCAFAKHLVLKSDATYDLTPPVVQSAPTVVAPQKKRKGESPPATPPQPKKKARKAPDTGSTSATQSLF